MNNENVEVKFKTQKRPGQKERKDYFKPIILNYEFGVQVLFDD